MVWISCQGAEGSHQRPGVRVRARREAFSLVKGRAGAGPVSQILSLLLECHFVSLY